MKIFLSYGHDSNTPLIEKIRDYLSNQTDGSHKHEVWIDKSEIKAGQDWRLRISEGIRQSDVVLAGLSKYSTRTPGVCRNEINISVGVMDGNIKTILLEPADIVAVPAMLSHIQWLDMSDWKKHFNEGFDSDYFKRKFEELAKMVITPENENFNGDIERLKASLQPLSSLSRIQSLLQNPMYGRQWLYKKIEDWDRQNQQRIFWIIGGPGFGKSTFAANLQQMYNDKIPAIQFVEWGKPDHSDPCSILRNLAFQLAVRYHDYLRQLLDLPQLDKLLEKNENELFDLLFCESMFLRINGNHENIWILIDALDEANDETGNKISQTIARHIDRLPQWMKFIITSRDDSNVRQTLQFIHPQVFDLENSVTDNNNRDIQVFLSKELSKFHPTEKQIDCIVQKSEGVFLYAKLLVTDITAKVYSLDNLDAIPNGIYAYYYLLFSRIYQNDIPFYDNYVSKILEIIASSSQSMHISLVKKCAQIESERIFYKITNSFQQLIRIDNDEFKFFHSSLLNWLTDPQASGCYYVSPTDGRNKILNCFAQWLNCNDTSYDQMWLDYHCMIEDCVKNNIALPNIYSSSHIGTIFRMYCPTGGSGIGSVVEYCYNNLGYMRHYLDNIIKQSNDESLIINAIYNLFELMKEMYINIGIVSPISRSFDWPKEYDWKSRRHQIYDTVKKSAFFSAIVEYVISQNFSKETKKKLKGNVEILAFYNSRLSDILYGEIMSLCDFADFTAREMKFRIEKL